MPPKKISLTPEEINYLIVSSSMQVADHEAAGGRFRPGIILEVAMRLYEAFEYREAKMSAEVRAERAFSLAAVFVKQMDISLAAKPSKE